MGGEQAAKSITSRAVKYLANAPRINKWNLRHNPGAKTTGRLVNSKVHNKAGKSHKELQLAAKPPLGWIFGDWYRPWQRRFPSEPFYNKDIYLRREYPPLSLLELQRLIDLGWLDVTQPLDLTSLCNTYQYRCNPQDRQFGVQLTDEGADIFTARVNLEVQWASELAIAAVERAGGRIISAYYDPIALGAVVDPQAFFLTGQPIPKRRFPPADLMPRYIDAKCRGYLADPAAVRDHQIELAQKYGYQPPADLTPEQQSLMRVQKDPLQLFLGLEPGWVVNLKDRTILKPKDSQIVEHYNA